MTLKEALLGPNHFSSTQQERPEKHFLLSGSEERKFPLKCFTKVGTTRKEPNLINGSNIMAFLFRDLEDNGWFGTICFVQTGNLINGQTRPLSNIYGIYEHYQFSHLSFLDSFSASLNKSILGKRRVN